MLCILQVQIIFTLDARADDSNKEFHGSPLYKLYTSYLLGESYKESQIKWQIKNLDTEDLNVIPEASSPLEKYYNQSIVWAKTTKGEVVFGFRPIDTVTGCTTGCTPVVFHLVINRDGRVEDILEEPGKPLRKKWHATFSKSDKKILLNIAKQLPEKLEYVSHPLDLTDKTGKFPPQTWTFFQDTLVPGGAYTCYAVYRSALLTYRHLNKDYALEYKENQEDREMFFLFQNELDSEKKFTTLFEEIKKLLDKGLTVASKKKLLKYILLLIDLDMKMHADSFTIKASKDKKLAAITEILNTYSKFYSQYFQSMFHDFLMNILSKPGGADIISYLSTHYTKWQSLPQYMKDYLPFLATSVLQDKVSLRNQAKLLNKEQLFNFVSHHSSLLEIYIFAYLFLGDYETAVQAFSRIKIRYPGRSLGGLPIWPDHINKKLIKYEQDELSVYSQELLREFEKTEVGLPIIQGTRHFEEPKPSLVTIPLNTKSKKQIYLFFAPWCAHCFELLSVLAERAPASFWEKVQLVSIFSKGVKIKDIELFCEKSGLKTKANKAFQEVITLEENKEVREFYKKMNLFAAPKTVVTDKMGKVVNFSYQFDLNPEKDFVRDLELILTNFS